MLVLLVLAPAAGAADAPTLYVDAGSVGGQCDDARTAAEAAAPATPWCTLARALAAAPGGSTVEVRGGTYPEVRLDDDHGRTELVTLRPFAGDSVDIRGVSVAQAGRLRIEGFTISALVQLAPGAHHVELVDNDLARQRITITAATDVLIEGNEMHDLPAGLPGCSCAVRIAPRYGAVTTYSERIVIRGNTIERLSDDPIHAERTRDLLVEGNTIGDAHPSGLGEHTDAIQILGGERITLRGNRIRNVMHGLMFTDHQPVDVTIESNIVSRVAGTALKTAGEEGMPGLRVQNNTFWDTGQGEQFRAAFAGAVVRNNIFDKVEGLGDQPTATHNLVAAADPAANLGAYAIRTPPTFWDADSGNLALARASAGIDAGAGDGAPAFDAAGRARIDDPEIADTGAGDPPYVDVGALERDPAEPGPQPPALSVSADAAPIILPPGVTREVSLYVFNGTDEAHDYAVTADAPWAQPPAGLVTVPPRTTQRVILTVVGDTVSPPDATATLTVTGAMAEASATVSRSVRVATVDTPAAGRRMADDAALAASPFVLSGRADPGRTVRLLAADASGDARGTEEEIGTATAGENGRWTHALTTPPSRGDHFAFRAIPEELSSGGDLADYELGPARLLLTRFGIVDDGDRVSDVAMSKSTFRRVGGPAHGIGRQRIYDQADPAPPATAYVTSRTYLDGLALEVSDAGGQPVAVTAGGEEAAHGSDGVELTQHATLSDGTALTRAMSFGPAARYAAVRDRFENLSDEPRTYHLRYRVEALGDQMEYRSSTAATWLADAQFAPVDGVVPRRVLDAGADGFVLSRHESSRTSDAWGHNLVRWHRQPSAVGTATGRRELLYLEYDLTLGPGAVQRLWHELGSERSDVGAEATATALAGPTLDVTTPAVGARVKSPEAVLVTGTARDSSGLPTVTVDGGLPIEVGGDFRFVTSTRLPDLDGWHDIEVVATDDDGHETTVVRSVELARPGDTAIATGPADPAASRQATFELTATPAPGAPVPSFECRLDQPPTGPWQPCASPWTLTDLQDGAHTFEARAVDSRGLADPTPAVWRWSVDATAPEPPVAASPEGIVAAGRPVFTWTPATDAGSGVIRHELLIDDLEPIALSADAGSHTAASDLRDGPHAWRVVGVDAAGNRAASPATGFTVDTTPPEPLELAEPADGATSTETPAFAWAPANDAATGVAVYELRVDGALVAEVLPTACASGRCDAPATGALGLGEHSWEVLARDRAGHERRSLTRTFTLVPPEPEPRPQRQPQPQPQPESEPIRSGGGAPTATPPEPPPPAATIALAAGELRWADAPGRSTNLTARRAGDRLIVASSAGDPVTAGAACLPHDGDRAASCALAGVRSLAFDLGDGDDRLELRGGLRIALTARGGAGNDELAGGGGPDVLDGGPGDDLIRASGGGRDRIACGAGADRLTWVDAKDAVAADCPAVPLGRMAGATLRRNGAGTASLTLVLTERARVTARLGAGRTVTRWLGPGPARLPIPAPSAARARLTIATRDADGEAWRVEGVRVRLRQGPSR